MARSNPDRIDPTDPIFLESMPLEASASLEESAPLEYRGVVSRVVASNVQQVSTQPEVPAPEITPPLPTRDRTAATNHSHLPSSIEESETVSLLEERLIVDRKKRKVGDVVVRKEIETRIIEVPVRREKLIVEQISPEYKQLASIDLGETTIEGVELSQPTNVTRQSAVNAEFASAKAASQFLATIASQPESAHHSVHVRIEVDNAEQQAIYQQWLDRYLATPER